MGITFVTMVLQFHWLHILKEFNFSFQFMYITFWDVDFFISSLLCRIFTQNRCFVEFVPKPIICRNFTSHRWGFTQNRDYGEIFEHIICWNFIQNRCYAMTKLDSYLTMFYDKITHKVDDLFRTKFSIESIIYRNFTRTDFLSKFRWKSIYRWYEEFSLNIGAMTKFPSNWWFALKRI